jgi:hypothetical protein
MDADVYLWQLQSRSIHDSSLSLPSLQSTSESMWTISGITQGTALHKYLKEMHPYAAEIDSFISDRVVQPSCLCLVLIMYGPPRDRKGKFGRETSLRQCIRPLLEPRAPGQDEFRCVSILTSRSVVMDHYQDQVFRHAVVTVLSSLLFLCRLRGSLITAKARSALDRCSQTVPKPLGAVSITLWHPCGCGPSPSLWCKISAESAYAATASVTLGR